MMVFWRITGLGMLAAALGWACLSGGKLTQFYHLPSVLIVVGFVSAGLWASFGPIDVCRAISSRMITDPNLTPQRIARNTAVIERGYQLSWGAGFVGALVGMVIMLQNMDDPSSIGPGTAVSLLSLLYGAALAEFGFNVLREDTADPTSPDGRQTSLSKPASMVGLGGMMLFAVVAVFFIMLAALSEIK